MISEFRHEVLKLNGSRKHKTTNSNGIKEAWRWLKKNKFFGEEPFTEAILGKVVKEFNTEVFNSVVLGKDCTLPYLGTLKVIKKERFYTKDGNKVITNLGVDWDRTLKLWESDSKSYKEKKLIYSESNYIYHIKFVWNGVKHRSLYKFFPSLKLKRTLKKNIYAGITDALLFK